MNSCVYTFRKLTSLSGEVIGRSVGSNTNALLIPSHFQLCSSVTFVAHIVNALVFLVGWILLFDTSCGADIYIKIPIFTVLLLTVEHYPLFNRWPLLTSCYERTNWLPHHREVVLLQFFFQLILTSFTDENSQKQADDLGIKFTEQFIQDPEHVTLLLSLLEVL